MDSFSALDMHVLDTRAVTFNIGTARHFTGSRSTSNLILECDPMGKKGKPKHSGKAPNGPKKSVVVNKGKYFTPNDNLYSSIGEVGLKLF